jgi:hypothetical protein
MKYGNLTMKEVETFIIGKSYLIVPNHPGYPFTKGKFVQYMLPCYLFHTKKGDFFACKENHFLFELDSQKEKYQQRLLSIILRNIVDEYFKIEPFLHKS